MGRHVKPGITFYRMDSGHIQNKKVRLLYNEFDSDGYYIWMSLLDYAYGKWGYYFDCNDEEELELFCSEYCKKKVQLVREVITGCIRRSLFDERVFNMFGILTSDMMQETFLIATSERRNKGSVFFMQHDWLILDFSQEHPTNISIVHGNNKILPTKNKEVQPNNQQIRLDKIKIEEIKEDDNGAPLVPTAPPGEVKEGRKRREKFVKPLRDAVRAYFKEIAGNAQSQRAWPDDKCRNAADQCFDHYEANGWVQGKNKPIVDWKAACRNWVRNEIEGFGRTKNLPPAAPVKQAPAGPGYNRPKQQQPAAELSQDEKDKKTKQFINDTYADFLAGNLNKSLLSSNIYDFLKLHGQAKLPISKQEEIKVRAQEERIKELGGSSERRDQQLREKYEKKILTTDEIAAESPALNRISKRLAIIEVFIYLQEQGKDIVFELE